MDDKVYIRFLVAVGHENEDGSQLELAHLLEHLGARGTVNFPSVNDFLAKNGLVLGMDFNALTEYRTTQYFINIPRNKPKLIMQCLRLIRDWAQDGILISPERVDAERTIVLQELNKGRFDMHSGNIVTKIIGDRNHNGRIQIDTRDNLKNFSLESVKRFYNDWYQPDRQGIIVVGDIDVDSMEADIGTLFSDLQKRGVKGGLVTEFAEFNGHNENILEFQDGLNGLTCQILFKDSYRAIRTVGDFGHLIRNQIMADLLNSRLQASVARANRMKNLNVEYKPIYINYGKLFSALTIDFGLNGNDFDSVLVETMAHVYHAKKFGFTAHEFDSAKTRLWRAYMDGAFLSNSIVTDLTSYFEHGDAFAGTEAKLKLVRSILDESTLESFNLLMRSFEVDKNRNMAVKVSAEQKLLVNDNRLRACLALARRKGDVYSVAREIPQRVKKITSFEPFMDSSKCRLLGALVRSHAQIKVIRSSGITQVTLPNRVKVLLKHVDNRDSGLILRVAKSLNRDEVDSTAYYYAGNVVFESGLGAFRRYEWLKYLRERNIGVSLGVTDGALRVSAVAKEQHLETVLQIIHEAFVSPRQDTAFFNIWKDSLISSMSNRATEKSVEMRYYGEVRKELKGGSPSTDSLKSLSYCRIKNAYEEMFSNNGSITVVLVGKYDSLLILALLEKYLGTIPIRVENSVDGTLGDRYYDIGSLKKKVFYGANGDINRADLGFPGSVETGPDADLKMTILKHEFSQLLTERLRSKEGISYGVRSYFVPKNFGKYGRYLLMASYDCMKGRSEYAEKCVFEELVKLKLLDTQKRILVNAKRLTLREYDDFFSKPDFLAKNIETAVLRGDDLEKFGDYKTRIENITDVDLIDLAKTFDLGNYMSFLLVPNESLEP